MDIQEMLDQLAEYQAQVDLLDLKERELLDEVKIPAEVLQAQDEANKRRQAVDSALWKEEGEIKAQTEAALAEITEPELPPDYAAAMRAYRAEVERINKQAANQLEQAHQRAVMQKAKIDTELQATVKDVYAQVDQRKRDIRAEFSEKASGAKDNIAALTNRIKGEVVKIGKSIKGQFYQAVYMRGRVTRNTDMLDGMIVAFPELAKARKEGEPSVSIRKV